MRGGIKLSFHGVRGSTPCAGDQYERYGGNTSCVALEADGRLDELARLLEARVPGVTDAKRVDSTVQLGVKGSHVVLPAVVTAAEQGGFTVTDLSLAEPTLETVFINLTGKELRD